MKSNILLTSMAALLFVSGANAMQYKPFVGATIGLQGVSYSDETEDFARVNTIDLPEDFFAFGIEGGFRFGAYNQIYNGGITINVDTTTSSDMKDRFTDARYAKISTSSLSATYDNYLRLSGDKIKRIDLVLGAGMGTMNYDIDDTTPANDDETIWSPMFAFKVGLDFELTQNITLSANTRFFAVGAHGYHVV